MPYKADVIRHWEKGRLIYNVLLVPPAFVGYVAGASIAVAVDDPRAFGIGKLLVLFVIAAIAANCCFSLVYAVEFLWQKADADPQATINDDPPWKARSRFYVVFVGALLSMALAFIVAAAIANMQYSQWSQGKPGGSPSFNP